MRTRHIKFIAASDLHGDMQCEKSVTALKKFTADYKPDIKLFLGDLWDFRSIRKGAGPEERAESMLNDFRAGCEFLKEWRPQNLLLGNHDARLYELAEAAKGVEGDYAMKCVGEVEQLCGKLGIAITPYHKRHGVLRVAGSHLKVLHGFACGVYAARQTALAYGSCLFGHIHGIDEASIPGLERRVARSIGCLCKLDMPYNSRHVNTLRQAHGFAYGVIAPNGDYAVWQAEEVGGAWMVAKDIRKI
jgi:hypothetical protein